MFTQQLHLEQQNVQKGAEICTAIFLRPLLLIMDAGGLVNQQLPGSRRENKVNTQVASA